MMSESISLKTTDSAENTERTDAVSRDATKNEKKRFIQWGAGTLLTIAIAWCVTCISLSMSYHEDPLVEKWDEYNMTAKEKIDILWDRISSSVRDAEEWPSIMEQMIRFFALQTDDTNRLKWQQTFRPFKNRRKVIHTQSAFGKIKWKPVKNNMGYTGLFAGDVVDGLVSYSSALDPQRLNVSTGIGLGVRLFRDNGPPASFVCMFPLPIYRLFTPIRFNYNIFETGPLCTHVSFLGGLNLLIGSRQRPTLNFPPKFVYRYPNSIGLLNLVNITKNGEEVLNPRVPYCICLRSNPKLAELLKNEPPWTHPVDILKNIASENHLYDIIAIDHPQALLDFPNTNKYAVKVGEIWSDSEFVSSKWGDQMLFVPHQDWELDIASRPDWKSHMNFRTLLLEGWSYYSIEPPKGVSAANFNEALFPAFVTVSRFFSNPQYFSDFICKDVGLCVLSAALQSAITAQDLRSSTKKENNKNAEENATKQDEEEMSGYDFFGYGNNSIHEAWQQLLIRWFSIPIKSNYRSHDILSMMFAPITPAFWNDFVSENEKLIRNSFLSNFEAEGHFLVPYTFTGLQQTLANPFIVAYITAAVEHIIKPYNVMLPKITIVNIINELIVFLRDPKNIAKIFSPFPGAQL